MIDISSFSFDSVSGSDKPAAKRPKACFALGGSEGLSPSSGGGALVVGVQGEVVEVAALEFSFSDLVDIFPSFYPLVLLQQNE